MLTWVHSCVSAFEKLLQLELLPCMPVVRCIVLDFITLADRHDRNEDGMLAQASIN